MGESGGSILVSNGLVGCPFVPDLLFKLRLEPIVAWFEAIKTWRGRGEFTPTNSGIKWPDRMPVHARFTF